ncbi:MAG TPA: UDP-3-O-acyl-N-acetylglucosamine deacetylase, partial [Bryobacteraceae bacterium]
MLGDMGTVSQRTLKTVIGCRGIGLHSGHKVSMTLHPAAADSGIVFRRTDAAAEIRANWGNTADSQL